MKGANYLHLLRCVSAYAYTYAYVKVWISPKTTCIRRISAVSNAIQTIDNGANHLIIYCLNCIRHGRNATYEPGLKAVANEDTLLLTTFPCARKLGNICCGHKVFLNKIRNSCVPDTKFVFAANVARAGKRGNISVGNNVSATMCPRLPVP